MTPTLTRHPVTCLLIALLVPGSILAAPRLAAMQTELIGQASGTPVEGTDAELSYQRMLQEDPNAIHALKGLAAIRMREGKLGDALALYRDITRLQPQDTGALIHLADLYSWTGDYDHAIVILKDIVAADSTNAEALRSLATILRWDSRYEESEHYYTQVLRAEPDDSQSLLGLARLHAYRKDTENALAYVDRVIDLCPGHSTPQRIKGDILAWSERYDEAEGCYATALLLDSTSAEVYRSLGDMYKWEGNFAAAAAAFGRGARLSPTDRSMLLELAESSMRAGLRGDAEDALRKVQRLEPDNPDAFALLRELHAPAKAGYAAIFTEYVKPASMILFLGSIAIYFRRRRDILKRRHRFYTLFSSTILPVVIVIWVVILVASRYSGIWDVFAVREALEFATYAVLVSAFGSLLYVSRANTRERRRVVLAIGAHPDDIELGCGGTLAKFKEMGYAVHGLVITSGEQGNPYTNERVNRRREAEQGAGLLGLDSLEVHRFTDTRLHGQLVDIKCVIEASIRMHDADVIITQSPHDVHQDHSAVFDATRIAARGDKTILCYEDVSTEPHFSANYFIDVTEYIEDKIAAVGAHQTQRAKPYMQPDSIRGRAAHRGLQAGVTYAEAFLLYRGVDVCPS